MITYGFDIKWGSTTFGVSGCTTRVAAIQEAITFAKSNGWTPPRWWQFWRWMDTRVPKVIPAIQELGGRPHQRVLDGHPQN